MNTSDEGSARRVETAIAWLTLAALAVYVPGETYVSWPNLHSPFYLVDAIAMALMLWGAVHSLRARPRCSPAVLCAAYGWAAANGWRSSWWRIIDVWNGTELPYGPAEAWVVGGASAAALIIFVILLALTARQQNAQS